MIKYDNIQSSCMSIEESKDILDNLKDVLKQSNITNNNDITIKITPRGVNTYLLNITLTNLDEDISEYEFDRLFELISCNEIVFNDYPYEITKYEISKDVIKNDDLSIKYNNKTVKVESIKEGDIYDCIENLMNIKEFNIEMNDDKIIIYLSKEKIKRRSDMDNDKLIFISNKTAIETVVNNYVLVEYVDFRGIPSYISFNKTITEITNNNTNNEMDKILNKTMILSKSNGIYTRYMFEKDNTNNNKYYYANIIDSHITPKEFNILHTKTIELNIITNSSYKLNYNGKESDCFNSDTENNQIINNIITLFNLYTLKDNLVININEENKKIIDLIHPNIDEYVDMRLLNIRKCDVNGDKERIVNKYTIERTSTIENSGRMEIEDICPIGTIKAEADIGSGVKSFKFDDIDECISSKNNYRNFSFVYQDIYHVQVYIRKSETKLTLYYIDYNCYNSTAECIPKDLKLKSFTSDDCKDGESKDVIFNESYTNKNTTNLINTITCPLSITNDDVYRKSTIYTITDISILNNEITLDKPYQGWRYDNLKLYRETGKRYRIYFRNIADNLLPFSASIEYENQVTIYPKISELIDGHLPMSQILQNLETTTYYIRVRAITLNPEGYIYIGKFNDVISAKPITLPSKPDSISAVRSRNVKEIQRLTLTASFRPEIQRITVGGPVVYDVYVIHIYSPDPNKTISEYHSTVELESLVPRSTGGSDLIELKNVYFKIVICGKDDKLPSGNVQLKIDENNVSLSLNDPSQDNEIFKENSKLCKSVSRNTYNNSLYITVSCFENTTIKSIELLPNQSEIMNYNEKDSYVSKYQSSKQLIDMTADELKEILEFYPTVYNVDVIRSTNSDSSSIYWTITFYNNAVRFSCDVNNELICETYDEVRSNNIEGKLYLEYDNKKLSFEYPNSISVKDVKQRIKDKLNINVNVSHKFESNYNIWDITFIEDSYNHPLIKANTIDLVGYNIETTNEIIQNGNEIGGIFNIIYNESVSVDFPYNVSEESLVKGLESLPGIDKVEVKRNIIGTEGGFEWLITFTSDSQNPRDLELLGVYDSDLTGENVNLHLNEIVKGSEDSPFGVRVSFNPSNIDSGLPIVSYLLKYYPLISDGSDDMNVNTILYNDPMFLYYEQNITISLKDVENDSDNSNNDDEFKNFTSSCQTNKKSFKLKYNKYTSDYIKYDISIEELRQILESIPSIKTVSIIKKENFAKIGNITIPREGEVYYNLNNDDNNNNEYYNQRNSNNNYDDMNVYLNRTKFLLKNGRIMNEYNNKWPESDVEMNVEIVESITYSIRLEKVTKYELFNIINDKDDECEISITTPICDECIYLNNLKVGNKYMISIAGINELGTGEVIELEHPIIPCEISNPPLNVKFIKVNNITLDIIWSEPSYTGGLPVIEYYTEISTSSEFEEIVANGTIRNEKEFRYRFSNLDPSYTYYGRVLGYNGVEFDNNNQRWGNTTKGVKPTNIVPSKPDGIVINMLNPQTIRISIIEPINVGGSDILYYSIEYGNEDGVYDNVIKYYPKEDEEIYPKDKDPIIQQHLFDLTNLTERLDYYIRVSAINEIGMSEYKYSTPKSIHLPYIPSYRHEMNGKMIRKEDSDIEEIDLMFNDNPNEYITKYDVVIYDYNKPIYTVDEISIQLVQCDSSKGCYYSISYYLDKEYSLRINSDIDVYELREMILNEIPKLLNIEINKRIVNGIIIYEIKYLDLFFLREMRCKSENENEIIVKCNRIINGSNRNGQFERQVLYLDEMEYSFRPFIVKQDEKIYGNYIKRRSNCNEMISDIEWSYSLLSNIGKVKVIESNHNTNECKYIIEFQSSFNDIEPIYIEYNDENRTIGFTCDGNYDNINYTDKCKDVIAGNKPSNYREFTISKSDFIGNYIIGNVTPSNYRINLFVEYNLYPKSTILEDVLVDYKYTIPSKPLNVEIKPSSIYNSIILSYNESLLNGGKEILSYEVEIAEDKEFRWIYKDHSISIDGKVLESNSVINCKSNPKYEKWFISFRNSNDNKTTFMIKIITLNFVSITKPIFINKVVDETENEVIGNIYYNNGYGSIESSINSLEDVGEVKVEKISDNNNNNEYIITFLDLSVDVKDVSVVINGNDDKIGGNSRRLESKVLNPNRCFGDNIEIMNLDPYRSYYVRVRSVNSIGKSEYAISNSELKPTVYPESVNDFRVSTESELSISVSIILENEVSNTEYYVIECDESTDFNSNPSGRIIKNRLFYSEITKLVELKDYDINNKYVIERRIDAVVNGLVDGNIYYIRIISGNSNGWSKESKISDPIKVYSIPQKPISVNVGITSRNSMTVEMMDPVNSIVNEYLIHWSKNESFDDYKQHRLILNESKSYTIIDLEENEVYYIRVASVNDVGMSEFFFEEVEYKPTTVPPGKPIITKISHSYLEVSISVKPPVIPHHGIWCSGLEKAKNCPKESTFNENIADGGSEILNYIVEYSIDSRFENNKYTYKVNVENKVNKNIVMRFEVPYDGKWYFRLSSENINGNYYYCNRLSVNDECDGDELIINATKLYLPITKEDEDKIEIVKS